MPVFEKQMELATDVDRLFDYLIRPSNLQATSPPSIDLFFVEPPEMISLGAILRCNVQAFGQPHQLEYEIVGFERPRGFREKMIRGPFKHWYHDYIISPAGSQKATLTSRVEFEAPSGILGLFLTPHKILSNLEEGFEEREAALQKIFA